MARGVSKESVEKGKALDVFKLGLEIGKKPSLTTIKVKSFKEKAWDAVEKAAEWLSEQLQAKSLYYGAKIYDKIQQLRVLNRLSNLERDFNDPGLTDSNLENYIRHIVRSEVKKPVRKGK